MAELRSNVELCLGLDGIGVLFAGWIFQPASGTLEVLLQDGVHPPALVSHGWVRFQRPDVLNSLAAHASEATVSANRQCGFIALAPLVAGRLYNSVLRLELSILEGPFKPVDVQLFPEPHNTPLSPGAAALLRHNVRPLLDLFRRHGVQAHPTVRELIENLGPEAVRIKRLMEAPASGMQDAVGVDLCVSGINEGMLLAGWFNVEVESVSEAALVGGSAPALNILPYLHFLPRDEQSEWPPPQRFVAALPEALRGFSRPPRLQVEFKDRSVLNLNFPPPCGRDAVASLASVFDAQTWLALSEAIGEHWTAFPGTAGADSVAEAVQPLAREGYAGTRHIFEAPSERIAAAIDHAFLIPNLGVLTVGWLLDPDDQVESVHAHFGGRPSPDLMPQAIRLSRPDVLHQFARWLQNSTTDRFGFCFLAPFSGAPSEGQPGFLYYTVRTRSTVRRRLRPSALKRCDGNPLRTIREILQIMPSDDVEGFCRHVAPVVERLWNSRPEIPNADSVVDIGILPDNPTVSVIVPIYGRNDFIEYQLSLFADDPDWKDAELIYVIDDPRISSQTVQLCREIHPLYRVPMRLVVGRQNRGFAAANNAGAARARGKLLLLLNSDVMPKRRGWLSELCRQYESLPGVGALGAKLLFPDGSLQHGGISFERIPRFPGLWLNSHPGKGLPAGTAAKGASVAVPAVSAACLMVDRDLYLSVGGLDEGYILGDFEDTDFCLKLRRAGRQICCAQSVELFHLERQSQHLIGSDAWRSGLTLYNAWVHTKRWDDSIRQLIASPT